MVLESQKKDIKLDKDYIFFNSNDVEKLVYIGFSEDKSDFYRNCLSDVKNKLKDTGLSKETLKKIVEELLEDIRKRDKYE